MSIESNKQIVRRYFAEVIDKANLDLAETLFAADCIIHRPEDREPILGLKRFIEFLGGFARDYRDVVTTIHDVIAEGDRVVCRLSHRATHRGEWTSRIGRHSVSGKTVRWSAMAIFLIRDGKIAEEWVCRDELGMLMQLGVVRL